MVTGVSTSRTLNCKRAVHHGCGAWKNAKQECYPASRVGRIEVRKNVARNVNRALWLNGPVRGGVASG